MNQIPFISSKVTSILKTYWLFGALLFSLTVISESTQAQSIKGSTPEQKQKEAERKKAEQKAEAAAFQEESRKYHRSIQDKKTQKRMKKSAKKAERNRKNKRGGFFTRLFH